MEVKFTKSFEKDLKSISNKSIVLKVDTIIQGIQSAITLNDISGIKQLKGHRNCYRARIGDFRLGLVLEGKIVWVARLMHRKEIYRFFP